MTPRPDKIGIESGDKASDENYDPVDQLMLRLSHRLNRQLYEMAPPEYRGGEEGNPSPSPIPNVLTLISLVAGWSSIVALLYHHRMVAMGLWICAYFFDCADGNYARMYKSSTEFGDWFDHISDWSKIAGLAVALYASNGTSLGEYLASHKVGVTVTIAACVYLLGTFGCLEEAYRRARPGALHSDTLAPMQSLCGITIQGSVGMGLITCVLIPALIVTRVI